MKKIILILSFSFISLFSAEHLTADNIDEKLQNKNAIVDFYAVWCPPCKIMSKNLKDFENSNNSDVVIYKVDVDKQPQLAQKFGVRTIPTTVYFKNGIFLKKEVGVKTVSQLHLNVKNYF
ncbi:thioredoxin [Malaciobacter canalis]|uniref:Thioredoxin n=1 Tax=Malaciobacter canalis TaxID=1912871 RepID=A0ABX4LPA9_9BACT|nr:thioredoxin family protein [Malaciobacter canalis]PHO09735.1 thioredoxin [Malaciobacter canalis]QEE34054.1 thioredoxin [Malaciobacter canalis]